jgi:hypothetical protein
MAGNPYDETDGKRTGGHRDQRAPSYALEGRLKHAALLSYAARCRRQGHRPAIQASLRGQALIQDNRKSCRQIKPGAAAACRPQD